MCQLPIARTAIFQPSPRLIAATRIFKKHWKRKKNSRAFRITALVFFSGALLLCSELLRADNIYSIGIEYGDVVDDVEVVQLLVTRNISEWFNQRIADAGSRGIDTKLAITTFHWTHSENDLYGASIGAQFIYSMHSLQIGKLTPHIEYALGTALISDTMIGTQDMSTAFHFKNQLGLGFRTQQYDFFVRASHLSNASIKQPNDGLNILTAGVIFKF